MPIKRQGENERGGLGKISLRSKERNLDSYNGHRLFKQLQHADVYRVPLARRREVQLFFQPNNTTGTKRCSRVHAFSAPERLEFEQPSTTGGRE
jgi:hypothetical protein